MIEEKKFPYEFLARWRDGKLTGAHVGFVTQIIKDGKVIHESNDDVMRVDIGAKAGFPLADILAQLHVDAIGGMDDAMAECKVATDACAKHEATIATLEAKIKELENAKPDTGAADPV